MPHSVSKFSSFENTIDFFLDVPKSPIIYRIGELFCGPGGMALGAKIARVGAYRCTHVWATDYEKYACETFKENIGGDVYCSRVEALDFNKMAPIDGLVFGFPCNDFSNVGRKRGTTGEFGGLFIWGTRALKHFKPLFFVAENVDGLRSSNGKKDLSTIIRSFESAGYVVSTQLYKLNEYGIPQTRNRLFIVGFRKGLRLPPFKHLKPTGETITCKMAIESPPIPKDTKNHELVNQQKQVIERLSFIKPGENAFNADIPKRLRLNVKGATISQIYRRLDPNKPAYTVTGSGGGGTHMYHWQELRSLTSRERARLQTFPDNFVFNGGRESVRAQVGMAVPPKISEKIFRAILQIFKNSKIRPQT